MPFDIDTVIRFGPVTVGLFFVVVFILVRMTKKRAFEMSDLFIVGITGSSVPAGLILVYAAYDHSVMSKLAQAPIYIALAGLGVLYIAVKTIRDKL